MKMWKKGGGGAGVVQKSEESLMIYTLASGGQQLQTFGNNADLHIVS